MTGWCHDGLRVELNAPGRMLTVFDPHDLTAVGPGDDLEIFRDRRALDDQRMIAGRLKRIFNPLKKRVLGMVDHGSLTMHDPAGPDNVASENMAEALMSQANTEDRKFPAESPDDVV